MPLQDNALTTVQAVKDELGLEDDALNAWIERQINAVSQDVERYCGRKFGRQTYTGEKYRGNNRDYLVLNNYPIIGEVTATINGVAVDDFDVLAEEGMLYRSAGWPWSGKLTVLTQEPVGGDYNIAVTYQAGYVLPKDEKAADGDTPAVVRTLPFDLEQAAIDLVVIKYRKRGSEHVAREVIGPLTSDYLPDMPEPVRNTLNRYRRVVV